MAHDNICQNCGKPISGNINKRFCSDACRRYYKRHGEVSRATPTPHQLPDKSGFVRTSARAGGSNLGNYAAKKGIDLLAKYAENTFIPPKPNANSATKGPPSGAPPTLRPLVALTAQAIMEDSFNDSLRAPVDLPPD